MTERDPSPIAGIYGIVRFDGNPVDKEDLAAMRRSLCLGGAHPAEEWIGRSAALGRVAFRSGDDDRTTVEAARPDCSGVLLVATARLDYKDDLCRELGISAPEASCMTDPEFIRAAREKWGTDAPRRLFGDWSLAAWNEKERTLFLARDHMGNTGLYYVHRPPFFAFASTSVALCAMPGVRFTVSEEVLARFLVVFPSPQCTETIWNDMRIVGPAQTLTVNSRTLSTNSYWSPKIETGGECGSDENRVEVFLDRFRAAVDTRIGESVSVASTLSSGLDSGSVTALAAQSQAAKGRTVTAFTSVPLHPSEHLVPGMRADELPLAAAIAARFPNIVHVPLQAESTTPLNGMRQGFAVHGTPLHAAVNMFWFMELYRETAKRGIARLLTGQLGNHTVSWSGGRDFILDLIVQGRVKESVEALRQWNRFNRASWPRTVKRHILGPLLRPLKKRAEVFLHPEQPPWSEYSALNPAFAERISLRAAMRREGHDPTFSRRLRPKQERLMGLMLNGTGVGPFYHAMALATGVQALDPTADIRLIDCCFAVPNEEYVREGGERMLVRRAMEGILPEAVRWNTVRGKQAADGSLRLLDHRDEMETMLESLDRSPAAGEYLDLRLMRTIWTDLKNAATSKTAAQASSCLLRGISTGIFLMETEKTRETPWG